MDQHIKPIETQYNGYRFRSRLEARWAVFFDTLGIRYEYEKEGFELGELGRYLPDFWLPEFELWVEIKPRELTHEERGQGIMLVRQTHYGFMAIQGSPWPDEYDVDYMPASLHMPDMLLAVHFAKCYHCAGVWLLHSDTGAISIGPHTCGEYRECRSARLSVELQQAFSAARGARFEYGESGAPA